MPIVKFYLPPLFSQDEAHTASQERILASARKQNKSLTDISEWRRAVLRNYLKQFITDYRAWEEEGLVIDPRTKKELELQFKPVKPLQLNMKHNGKAFDGVVVLTDKQLSWLQLAIPFGRQKVALLNKQEGLDPVKDIGTSRCVGDFLRMLFEIFGRQALLAADFQDIDEEPVKQIEVK